MSVYAWLSYLISSIIVGFLARKSPVISALLAGGIVFGFYTLIELPDWPYFLHFAPQLYHPYYFLHDGFTLIYYFQLGIGILVIFIIGGFVGKNMQAYLGAKHSIENVTLSHQG